MDNEVLAFWFEEIEPKKWWAADREFDDQIQRRFGSLLDKASKGELYLWRKGAKGRLAEIIVLDQFSRNIHRNSPAAFSQDSMALALAQEAVAVEFHKQLKWRNPFLYIRSIRNGFAGAAISIAPQRV